LWMQCTDMICLMEANGIKFDMQVLDKKRVVIGEECEGLTQNLRRIAGDDAFNPGSSEQLSHLLFDDDKLAIPVVRGHEWKKKGYWGTAEDQLKPYEGKHEALDMALDLRKRKKLLNTYVMPLMRMSRESHDGRVHPSFRMCGTVTGRLASRKPNAQNMPKDKGVIRDALVAEQGFMLIGADYNQLEFRMAGHWALALVGWSKIAEAYARGEDVHATTQKSLGFKDRRDAKIVNFGFIYGRGAKAFAADNDMPLSKGQEWRRGFFRTYRELYKVHDAVAALLSKHGRVKTISGRQRHFEDTLGLPIDELWWPAWVAWNSIVQGSAADVVMIAMRNMHRDLMKKREKDSDWRLVKPLIQVHDELLFEFPDHMVNEGKKWVEDHMSNAVKLKVPLIAEAGAGHTWEEAKAA